MTASLDILTLRQRAAAFAKEFSKSTYEMGEAQEFIRGLCRSKDDAARVAFLFERYQEQLAR